MISRLSVKLVLWSLLLSAILGLLVLLSLFSNAQTCASYNYQVSFPNPGQHYVSVQLKVENLQQDTLELRMPVWTLGYYWILDLPAIVFDFEIQDQSGKKANWCKTSKNCWQIVTKGISILQVSYQVYANAQSVAEPYAMKPRRFYRPPEFLCLTRINQMLQLKSICNCLQTGSMLIRASIKINSGQIRGKPADLMNYTIARL